MSITRYRKLGLAGFAVTGTFVGYEVLESALTALGAFPFHPIHFLIGTGTHVALAAGGYFLGVKPTRWFYSEAKRRELPKSSRKALAS